MKHSMVIGYVFFVTCLCGIATDGYCRDYADRRQSQSVKLTFLDTLNQGHEIGIFIETEKQVISDEQSFSAGSGSKSSDGFRIQLIASRLEDAIRIKKPVVEKDLRYKAVVEYEAPFYKLYVGNFVDRKEAETALASIKEAGYPDAWIVKQKGVTVDE